MTRNAIGWLPLAGVAVLAGCGGKPGPVACRPVSGQVLCDGRPAAGVRVFFLPTSAPGVPDVPCNPHAVTGADGRFALSTFGTDDGAAEGGYLVLLEWPPPGDDDQERTTDKLLGWYDAAHSKLAVVVTSGGSALPPFKVVSHSQPPPTSEGVPGRN